MVQRGQDPPWAVFLHVLGSTPTKIWPGGEQSPEDFDAIPLLFAEVGTARWFIGCATSRANQGLVLPARMDENWEIDGRAGDEPMGLALWPVKLGSRTHEGELALRVWYPRLARS